MQRIKINAFTLIELLVVIAIIGILSALIVVGMSSTTQKATIAKAQVFSNSLRNSLMLNLTSEFHLDGNTTDTWGNITASWSGPLAPNTAITWITSGCISNSCLDFDGQDDQVSVVNNAVFNNINFTVEFWIKPDQLRIQGIIYKNAASYWRFFMANGATGNIEFDGSGEIGNVQSGSIVVGKWYHIVGTYNGDIVKVYDNGYEHVSASGIGTMNNENAGPVIVAPIAGSRFDGLIDEVRLYNAAMPTSQIKQNYFAGLNRLLVNNQINDQEYGERLVELTKNYAKD
ncbi:MAG: LamG-like jellyroll fold domain-containing protein [Candidatus Paceibacterota bacterium]